MAAVAALHDAELPDTYAPAAQLVAGEPAGTRVVLVADGDGDAGGPAVAGYAAGEVHDDGEGFVDFLAVDPVVRGTGVGRRLVVALTRRLLDRSPPRARGPDRPGPPSPGPVPLRPPRFPLRRDAGRSPLLAGGPGPAP